MPLHLQRESTEAQCAKAVNALVDLASVIPKFIEKTQQSFVYVYENFKTIIVYTCVAFCFLIFVILGLYYTETKYDIKSKLADFFAPYQKTKAVDEF